MVPDYYAMLGVDPRVDRAALEAALARCQPLWSSGTRNPKTKHTYQSYLDQIPELRRTLLGDPTVRAAYDAELAAAERRRWMQKSQVTAEKTAWLEVVSHAQSHLTEPAERARYDRTLRLEAEDALNESITFALKGLSRLDPGTRAALIDEATARGIMPERAEALIARSCRAQGVLRDGTPTTPTLSGPLRYLRCRSCAGVTDFAQVAGLSDRAECRHCRASLHWQCPACRQIRWVDEARCSCG